MTHNVSATLYILGDRRKTVDGPANDLRGRQVKDQNGDGIGDVAYLFFDDLEEKVRFLLVEDGGLLSFGATKSLIPVDAVTRITEADVFVAQSRDRVAAAPIYKPDPIDDRTYHASIYAHYGHRPYWGHGYVYPRYPAFASTSRPVLEP